jgi:AcrR family transcriptional regulator
VPTPTTRKPTTRQQQAEARRLQIIDAALSLFAQNGYAGTSTKSIAQEVGITEGLIFHYFPTKADLLLAAARQRMTFLGEVLALLGKADERPARQVLGGIVLGWVQVIQRQADLVTMLLVESQTNDELRTAFRGVVGQIVGAMSVYLESRVEAGELRADLHVQTSAMIFFSSLMMFFLTHRDLGPDEWGAEASAFTSQMLDTWFQGALAPRPPTAAEEAT